jgi:VanZ family protein
MLDLSCLCDTMLLYPYSKGISVTLLNFYRLLFFCALLLISGLALVPLEQALVSTGWDKSNHVLAFAVLLLLLDSAYPSLPMLQGKLLLLLVYGLAIEVAQHFIPYREFSLFDVLADIVGLLVYLLIKPWLIRCRALLVD